MDSPPPGRRGQGWRRKIRSQPIPENRSNLIDSPHPYPSPLGAGSQQEPVFWKRARTYGLPSSWEEGSGVEEKKRSQPISENRSNLIDSPHPYPSPLGAGSQQEPVFWKKEPSNFQKQPSNFRKQPLNFRKQPPIDNLIPYYFHLIPARFSYACSGQLSDLGLIKIIPATRK